jgi:hypothetical protein
MKSWGCATACSQLFSTVARETIADGFRDEKRLSGCFWNLDLLGDDVSCHESITNSPAEKEVQTDEAESRPCRAYAGR